MDVAVGKLATVVVARPTVPDTVLVAVVVVAVLEIMVRYVFLQGQQIRLNCGYGEM